MPTINLQDGSGRSLTVGDEFTKLSPQDQQSWVNEVAAGLPQTKADDHGLAARQAMSPLEKAISPITEYPRNYQEMRNEAENQVTRGFSQLAGRGADQGAISGPLTTLKGVGNIGLGALGFVGSPISAAYRSVIGQPLEDVTGIPREYTEFAAQLATPGMGMTRLPEAPGAIAGRPTTSGFQTTRAPEPSPPPSGPMGAVENAAANMPLAATTQNRLLQQTGQILTKNPFGSQIGNAFEASRADLGAARNAIAEDLGRTRAPTNVAADIGEQLGAQRDAEIAAAKLASEQRATDIAQRATESAHTTEQQLGPTPEGITPPPVGQTSLDTVKENFDRLNAEKNAKFENAGSMPGEIKVQGLGSLQPTAQGIFDESGRALTDRTPAANDVKKAIEEISTGTIPKGVSGKGIPQEGDTTISLQGVNTFRKHINSLARSATNPEDAAAAQAYINGFDKWATNVVETHLASGDPAAVLQAHREANAANTDLMNRFGFNAKPGESGLKTINKIVTPGDTIGPTELTNTLLSGTDRSVRLHNALMQAISDHPEGGAQNVTEALRRDTWNKIAGTGEGQTARTPEKIANDIHGYMNNNPMAGRIYTPSEQMLGRLHADTLRTTQQASKQAALEAKTAAPGPAQELADRVLGSGQKPGEALYSTIESYAKSKTGGKDIQTLGQLWSRLPEELRGDFRNTFIRNIGNNDKGQFSENLFNKEWTESVNPRAKQIILGNSEHVAALDKLAQTSEQFDLANKRFGNPSGTGGVNQYLKMAGMVAKGATDLLAWKLIGPLKIVGSALGIHGVSRLLSTPAGASSAAKFAQRMQALQEIPTMSNAVAAVVAKRNVINTANALRIPVNTSAQGKP